MAYERRDVAARDAEADCGVDHVCEEGDAVFEEVACDLHHAGRGLD